MRNPVALICEASGIPLPTISWLKDGQPIKTTSSARILSGLFLFDFSWLFKLLVLIFTSQLGFRGFNICNALPLIILWNDCDHGQMQTRVLWKTSRKTIKLWSKRMLILIWKVGNGNCNKVWVNPNDTHVVKSGVVSVTCHYFSLIFSLTVAKLRCWLLRLTLVWNIIKLCPKCLNSCGSKSSASLCWLISVLRKANVISTRLKACLRVLVVFYFWGKKVLFFWPSF